MGLVHAEACGDAPSSERLDPEGRDGLPQTLGDLHRFLEARSRQEGAELLAAEACHQIVGAQHAFRGLGDGDEDLVAGIMAERVVDALEMVDIEHDDRERLLLAARASDLGADYFGQPAAIAEPGERVREGLPLEAIQLLLERVDERTDLVGQAPDIVVAQLGEARDAAFDPVALEPARELADREQQMPHYDEGKGSSDNRGQEDGDQDRLGADRGAGCDIGRDGNDRDVGCDKAAGKGLSQQGRAEKISNLRRFGFHKAHSVSPRVRHG